MDPALPLLALRLAGQEHALECHREYVLGSAADCDLRLPPAAAPHHARLVVTPVGVELVDLGSAAGTTHNGVRVDRTPLAVGDMLGFGDGVASAFVVRDLGTSAIVPIPAMRQARVEAGVRTAAMALLRPDAEALPDRLRREMRQAPWFLVSLAVHGAFLAMFWWLLPQPPAGDGRPATVQVDVGVDVAAPPGPPGGPEVALETSEPAFAPTVTPEPPTPTVDTFAPDADSVAPRPVLPTRNAPIGLGGSATAGSTPGGGGGSSSGGSDLGRLGSGAFRKTVGELRQSGLEIVFVFDSTGSMTSTIHETKTTIAEMLSVLRALVPDARIGLVTYRDRGQREAYLVRQLPLGLDHWRAHNFMQFITAEGGGDRPEDVRAGMSAAFQQDWREGARRVIVLAGDAPPHEEDLSRLLAETRAFAANGRSFVHTLVVSPDSAGNDTKEAFAAIAKAGKGTSQSLAARDRVLQRVLTVAFGHEFDQDVASVVRTVAAEAERVDVRALDLARRGGPELAAALRQDPVPQVLWNALVRRPRRAVVQQLVELLGAPETRQPTRQAVAAALQQILELPLPPIDGNGDTAPGDLPRLRARAARLAD